MVVHHQIKQKSLHITPNILRANYITHSTIKLNIIGPKVSNSVQMTRDGFVWLLIFLTNRHGGLITHACAYAFVCGYIVLSINFLPLILTTPPHPIPSFFPACYPTSRWPLKVLKSQTICLHPHCPLSHPPIFSLSSHGYLAYAHTFASP